MTNKIIMTAFEPFDGRETNISLEVLKAIDGDIIKKTIPVSYKKAPIEIKKILEEKPDILVLTGEAVSRNKLTIEKFAYNEEGAKIPDNDGLLIEKEAIDNAGMAKYQSNIDVDLVVKKLNNSDILVSNDPGRFICNLVYYTALLEIDKKNLTTKVVFIHYPGEKNVNIIKEIFPTYIKNIIKLME